jgi:hypothetical protein
MSGAGEDLERRCRELVNAKRMGDWDSEPVAFVEREIAVTLEQLDNLRRRHEVQSHSMTERECEIDSRILNLYPRPLHYTGQIWTERITMINKLVNTLVTLEGQQRRAAIEYDRRAEALHNRLLQLLNMRDQVHEPDGHPRDSTET